MFGDVLERPVPPGQGEQAVDVGVAVPAADELGRVAADDAVVGDIVDDDGTGRDDRAMAIRTPGITMAR